MSKRAVAHLSSDPVMAALIEKVGIIPLRPLRLSPFQSLTHAIIHQQLSGTAAGTILARFQKLFPDDEFPAPGQVAKASVDQLRAAGLSRPKAAYRKVTPAARRSNAIPLPPGWRVWNSASRAANTMNPWNREHQIPRHNMTAPFFARRMRQHSRPDSFCPVGAVSSTATINEATETNAAMARASGVPDTNHDPTISPTMNSAAHIRRLCRRLSPIATGEQLSATMRKPPNVESYPAAGSRREP